MPQTLHVHSRVKDYDILFTDHVLKTLADCLGERKQRKLLFITDQTVYHLYQTLFEEFAQQYNAFVHVCPREVNPNPWNVSVLSTTSSSLKIFPKKI